MSFTKYPKIENSFSQKAVNAVVDYGHNKGDWVVTEKIHGANFCIYIYPKEGKFEVAKRTSLISQTEKFFDWRNVVNDNRESIEAVLSDNEFVNCDEIRLYGELYGGHYPHPDVARVNSTMVQKGVYYCPQEKFIAFDLVVDGHYKSYYEMKDFCEDFGFEYLESLMIGSYEEVLKYPNAFQTTLPAKFSLPEIENNICEGVVLKPIEAAFYPAGSRVILKNKNDKFKENSKGKREPKQIVNLPSEEQEVLDKLLDMVCENRFNGIISKIGYTKNFGQIMKMMSEDVLEDHDGFVSDQVMKKFGKCASGLIRPWFLAMIDEMKEY